MDSEARQSGLIADIYPERVEPVEVRPAPQTQATIERPHHFRSKPDRARPVLESSSRAVASSLPISPISSRSG